MAEALPCEELPVSNQWKAVESSSPGHSLSFPFPSLNSPASDIAYCQSLCSPLYAKQSRLDAHLSQRVSLFIAISHIPVDGT